MALVLGATVVSGQKTALFAVPVFFLLQLILTENRRKNLAIKLGLIAVSSALLISQVGFLQRVITDFMARWDYYYSPITIVTKQFRSVLQEGITPFGHGLGTTASAARRLGDIRLIEVFYGKIIYEIGIVGFLAFLFLMGAIAVLTFRHYRSLTDPTLKTFALCLWLFIVFVSLNPYYYPLMVDPVTIYYWLVAGILFKLPALDKMAIASPVAIPKAWWQGDYGFPRQTDPPKLEAR
jgi:hypothetical protein